MTTIYRGTVEDVTAEILVTWLHRHWLSLTSDDVECVPLSDIATLYKVRRDGWRGQLLEMRWSYMTTWHFDNAVDMWTEAGQVYGEAVFKQWRASKVEVMFWETESGLFADSLRSWLADRYGCKVTHQQLTRRQQEQWNELQNFTNIVNESGREIQDVEQDAPYRLEKGSMRKKWNRLRAKIGVDPPWPR